MHSADTRIDWPAMVVGSIFFLIGAIFGGVGLWKFYADYADRRLLDEQGQRARGEVLHKAIYVDRSQSASVRPRYRVEYRFTPALAESVRAAAEVASESWARLESGGSIAVAYLASDPSIRRVEGERHDRTVWVVFALIGAVFAPLGGWLAKSGLRRAKPAPARRPGIHARIGDAFARAPALLLGLAGLVFFLPFAAGGAFWLDTTRSVQALLEARGRQVEGLVLSKAIVHKSNGKSRSTHHRVSYRFNADGAEVVGTSDLDSDAWERLAERGSIALVYAAGSPWLHQIEGVGAAWFGPLMFLGVGGLGMLGSGAAATWGWRNRGQPKRRQRPAPPPVAKAAATELPTKPHNRSWLIGAGVGAIFFFAGCAALVEGVSDCWSERRYASEGRVVDARATEKTIQRAERGRGSTEYIAPYRFATADGTAADGRAILDANTWEATKPGDRIRVRYLASEPRVNRPADAGGMVTAIVLMIVGPLFALLGALLAWGSWLARRGS